MAFHRAGQNAEAETIYRSILAQAPEHPYALNYLGVLAAAGGRTGEGIELLRRSAKKAPNVPEFHLNLGDALAASGRLTAAEAAVRKALSLKRSPDALMKLGIVLILQKKPTIARNQLEQALALDPGHAAARHNLGMVEASLGDVRKAYALFRGVLALQPSHIDSLTALGGLQQQGGGIDAALRTLGRVQSVARDFVPALFNTAELQDAFGRTSEAGRTYRRALALSPDNAGGLSGFSGLLLSEGRALGAEAAARRAVALDGTRPDLLSNLGRTLNPLGRVSEAIATYRRALKLDPRHAISWSNLLFAMILDPATRNEPLFEEYRRRDTALAVETRTAAGARSGDLDPGRRLRIGFLSGDFRDHPIGHLMLGYFENHDRRAVTLHAYSGHRGNDGVGRRIRSCVETWRETIGADDAGVADMIRKDHIDILVLLAGQTGGNRAGVCAHRAAPIQVNLHDLSTSGMTTIDAWLTDWTLHPQDTTEGNTERLVRLPSLYLYPRNIDAPDIVAPPSGASGRITFGSFSNPAKVNDEVLALWASILAAVKQSRLCMSYLRLFDDPNFQALMRRRLGRFGVAADRIDFMPSVASRREHLQRLGAIDISLDPFPFTGGTTVFEALWMGVPVVTLAGERFAARSAASHLAAAGYQEFIAQSADEYASKAVALAGNRPRLAELRRSMRAQVAASRLCDAAAYAASVDRAWRALWIDFCRQEALERR
jgi:predicted O-linked N-acetylglucosamine transferase (SPINDLY family)